MALRTVRVGTDADLCDLLRRATAPEYAGAGHFAHRVIGAMASAAYPGRDGAVDGRGAGSVRLEEAFLPAAAAALRRAIAANPGHPGAGALAALLKREFGDETGDHR